MMGQIEQAVAYWRDEVRKAHAADRETAMPPVAHRGNLDPDMVKRIQEGTVQLQVLGADGTWKAVKPEEVRQFTGESWEPIVERKEE